MTQKGKLLHVKVLRGLPIEQPILQFRMLLSPTLKTTIMENEIDYLVADENCKQAINDLMKNTNKEKWLRRYCRLFRKVSICPTGLPNIANANFDGVNYSFIRLFHNEYQLVQLELSN